MGGYNSMRQGGKVEGLGLYPFFNKLFGTHICVWGVNEGALESLGETTLCLGCFST
jgi:hypothetical protein